MRAGQRPTRHTTARWMEMNGISWSEEVTAAGAAPAARAGAEPTGQDEGAGRTALSRNRSPAFGLQFPALPLGAAAKLSGLGFQPGRFPAGPQHGCPQGREAWQPPCIRFSDSSRRLWSPSLSQATPADMFAGLSGQVQHGHQGSDG